MRRFVALAILTVPLWGTANQDFRPLAWEWHGSLERGKAVDIRGITGDIRAFPSTTGALEVSASIETDGVRETVEIRAVESLTGMTFCAVRRGSSACASDSLSAPAARVDYEVHLPAGVHLTARTVNGEIDARSLSGNVDATTVNGGVVVSTSGIVQARTVNGSIDAALLKPFWAGAPEFSAINGRIKVTVPTKVNLDVHAETRNGRIVTNVPDFRGVSTEQRLDGHVGGSGGTGNRLVIRTLNGTIELRQNF